MQPQEQIFYDTDCPMCSWYTGQMESKGLLEPGVRTPHHHIHEIDNAELDVERSRDEIAFYNHQTGETVYGLEAMLTIVGRQFPKVEKIGRVPWIKWCCLKLYRFISFNRQIIASNGKTPTDLDCTPHYHAGYRWAFVIFSVLVSTIITWLFASWFEAEAIPVFTAIAAGWGLFFVTTRPFLEYRKWFDLLSHTSSVMLQGVLIFGISIPFLFWTPTLIATISVGVLISLSFYTMNKGMLRRMRRMELSKAPYFWWLICLITTAITTILLFTKLLETWTF